MSAQLQSLLELDLIRREVPITERQRPMSRNSLYFLADHYLAFWYRYVDPNRSLVVQGLGGRVLQRIRQSFAEYVSRPPFEEVCRQFLWRASATGRFPPDLLFDEVGTWWDGNHELDVVAREDGRTVLVGSCKWTQALVGENELAALQQTVAAAAGPLRPSPECYSALFSRSGFTDGLLRLAQQPDQRLLLFTPGALFD